MEQRRKTFEKVYQKLCERYETLTVNTEKNFKYKNTYFRLFEFPGENALCIEYAEGEKEARVNRYEDGDRFYLNEMDEEEMMKAMIKEIED